MSSTKENPTTSSRPNQVEEITPQWRHAIKELIRVNGRGAHARLAEEAGIDSERLAEMLADDEIPGQARYSRTGRVTSVNNAASRLWPEFLPPTLDTAEIKYLLDGLLEKTKDALRALRKMSPEEQSAWADAILRSAARKP